MSFNIIFKVATHICKWLCIMKDGTQWLDSLKSQPRFKAFLFRLIAGQAAVRWLDTARTVVARPHLKCRHSRLKPKTKKKPVLSVFISLTAMQQLWSYEREAVREPLSPNLAMPDFSLSCIGRCLGNEFHKRIRPSAPSA